MLSPLQSPSEAEQIGEPHYSMATGDLFDSKHAAECSSASSSASLALAIARPQFDRIRLGGLLSEAHNLQRCADVMRLNQVLDRLVWLALWLLIYCYSNATHNAAASELVCRHCALIPSFDGVGTAQKTVNELSKTDQGHHIRTAMEQALAAVAPFAATLRQCKKASKLGEVARAKSDLVTTTNEAVRQHVQACGPEADLNPTVVFLLQTMVSNLGNCYPFLDQLERIDDLWRQYKAEFAKRVKCGVEYYTLAAQLTRHKVFLGLPHKLPFTV